MKNLLPFLLAALSAVMLSSCAQRGPAMTRVQTPELSQAAPEVSETPAASVTPEPEDDEFVRAADYIPDVLVDLKYATPDNFTGQTIYTFQDAYLRYGTVKKLASAAEELREQGYRLLIWDAFRPASAQWKLWDVCPNAAYVSDPNKGFSSHSRGNTVDVTLAQPDGSPAEMPSGFDDFTAHADRDYSDAAQTPAQNAALLENVMKENGFKPYSAEWWHFSDETAYPVEESFVPEK